MPLPPVEGKCKHLIDVTLIDQHIGERIRKRRTELRLSQQTLAQNVGRSFQQIHKYENGTNRVSASLLYVMAHELSVPITYFYEDMAV